MLKPRLEIPRLTEDEMREMVLDRLACQVMFGTEVRERDVAMVFGCALVFPGILMPPPELIEKHLGSSEPPETLEGEPPRPEHPGYPEGAGDPPKKPTLLKVPDDVRIRAEWGLTEESELDGVKAEVKAANEARIRAWDDDSMAWHEALDEERRVRRELDAAYESSNKAWEASLSQHEEAVKSREEARAEWEARLKDVFSDWTSDYGTVVGNMKDIFPRAYNGYPIFHRIRLIHKEDWKRIEAAIVREQERSEKLVV